MLKQRRIVVLTDDSIRSFEFDSKTQACSFMLVSAFVVWGVFSAVYYAGTSGAITRYRHSAGAAAERNSDLVRRNVLLSTETKKLTEQISEMALLIDKLESASSQSQTAQNVPAASQAQPAAVPSLPPSAEEASEETDRAKEEISEARAKDENSTEISETASAEAAPADGKAPDSTETEEEEVADAKSMNLDVAEAAVKKIKNRVGIRVAAIKKATELLPVSARRLLQNIPETVDSLHQGGPYVPDGEAETSRADDMADQMMRAIAYLTELEKRLKFLPVAFPEKDFAITSGFGGRIDPFTGKPAGHFGLDLNAGDRATVMAAAGGRVVRSGRSGAYGNMVEIDHGNGFSTRYGHLSKTLVEEGDVIKQGQKIGLQGSTGRSTGSHLHYEVRYNNTAINPYQFLKAAKYVF